MRHPTTLLFAELGGLKLRFLPRHGRGHRLSPTHINYRANIDAMKRAGVTDIVSVSAVGSLREDFAPGEFVIVDQFIDRTFAREKSFFGDGVVAHVSMAQPMSPLLAERIALAAEAERITVPPRRHLPRHGGPAILHARREPPLSLLGLRRHRHDQHAGGEARARGGDFLRHDRHGDRLRQLAP